MPLLAPPHLLTWLQLIEQGVRDQVALFALYWPSHLPYTHAGCTVGSAAWMPLVDPCDWGGALSWQSATAPTVWSSKRGCRHCLPPSRSHAPMQDARDTIPQRPILSCRLHAAVLYVHPICAKGAAAKEAALRAARFWFMDGEQGGCAVTHAAAVGPVGRAPCEAHSSQTRGCLDSPLLPSLPDHALPLSLLNAGCSVQPGAVSGVPACRPLHWRQPDVEAAHYSCPSFGLGLVHGRLSAAAQALRDGASGEEAKRLLRLSADKTCTGRGEGRI